MFPTFSEQLLTAPKQSPTSTCQLRIVISKKINTGNIAVCMDQGPDCQVAALCYQKYTVLSSMRATQGVTEGVGLMLCKEMQLTVRANF